MRAQGIFNDDAFAKMKRGARLVNVARGGVVDDASLVRALDAGIVAQVRMRAMIWALLLNPWTPFQGQMSRCCAAHPASPHRLSDR